MEESNDGEGSVIIGIICTLVFAGAALFSAPQERGPLFITAVFLGLITLPGLVVWIVDSCKS